MNASTFFAIHRDLNTNAQSFKSHSEQDGRQVEAENTNKRKIAKLKTVANQKVGNFESAKSAGIASSTGIKGIDLLVAKHSIVLSDDKTKLSDNAFQKSLVLYGQDQRLDFMNLPPCMFLVLSAADHNDRFTLHRFYLPYKNGVRFATYLLNESGDVIESVCYQRGAKYLKAFKVIGSKIAYKKEEQATFAA
ncbi:hypothetical protein ISG33_07560 [Glaciecola sp. MH2013]|uniref:hypothetical protein n=1 Tax=Glaciecola sp. MH2013 TaxID=2785524 RepID=UPI00189FDAFB|nr:hypothetical protein [Glaciecola sp. MH2013]MBF7073249.1 hypothetical protein [Glaciecola sp. MH2013]